MQASNASAADEGIPNREGVVIFCDAGAGRGYGNLYRSAALADAFLRTGYKTNLLIDAPHAAEQLWGGHAARRLARADLTQDLLGLAKRGARPPLICIDSRDPLTRDELHLLAQVRSGAFFVHLNDAAVTCDVPYHAIADYGLTSGQDEFGRLLLGGLDIVILRPSVRRARPAAVIPPTCVLRLLVTLGAEDPGRQTEALLKRLQPRQLVTGSHIAIVCGPGWSRQRIESLESLMAGACAYDVHVAPSQLERLMLSSDLVVTMGGQSSLEACCLGVPNASIEWSWLTPYVRELAKQDLTVSLGSVDAAARTLAAWLGEPAPAVLGNVARAGWRRIDGRGADRLAQKLISVSGVSSDD